MKWGSSGVLNEFPRDERLREQCALWMHAVVGKHFFPDANHRTAVALLRKLLFENQISYKRWSADRLRQARKNSRLIRLCSVTPVRVELPSLKR